MSDAFELTVRASTASYSVRIEEGALAGWLGEHAEAFAIADERFAGFAGLDPERTVLVRASENEKTLAGTERALLALRRAGARRGDKIVAIGGGIVQDIATLVAQLYMRGLRWVYAPTTLLAMADSCIGGKSSINAGEFKNLVGSFHPPHEVVVDTAFLETLPDEARAGGLAEAMKISYCRGPEAFAAYAELAEGFPESASALVHHALECKRWFIEIDEFDRAERRLLNFGHTFGHALEAATTFAVPHGIGVAVGVMAAERFAVEQNHGPGDPELVAQASALARRAPDLPARAAVFDPEVFTHAFLADKKHGRDGLHLILPTGEGRVEEVVVGDRGTAVATAQAALRNALATVGGI